MAKPGTVQQLPPRQDSPRRIVRVKYAEHGPGPRETPTKPARELTAEQGTLEPHTYGVMVHGKYLVPWANIYWIELEAQ